MTEITPFQSALSGSVAVVGTKTRASYPDVSVSRILSRQSVPKKYQNIAHAVSLIGREEGLRGFWKGNLSAEYLYLTYGAIQFYAYDSLKADAKSRAHLFAFIPSSMDTFVSGAIAGAIATSMTYPFDLLRTRFAVQGNTPLYTSLWHAVKSIHASEGISGFYRGLGPSLFQIIPQMGLVFESHSFFQWKIKSLESRNPTLYQVTLPFHELISGALAGIVSKTAVMPFDVIRKRFQVQGPMRNSIIISDVPNYSRGVMSAISSIITHEGFFGLYKGIGPSLLKAAPSSAVTFFVVNQCHLFFKSY